jgi:predicted DNA-binding transcriptional regulator YafY
LALTGDKIVVSDLAEKYRISTKSVMRDLNAVRCFLSENRELTGDLELKYDRKEHCYKLSQDHGLQKKDLLLIAKILIGSKALERQSMEQLLDKLPKCCGQSEDAIFQNIRKNELEYYCPSAGNTSGMADKIWKLENLIRAGRTVCIRYHRLDESDVERELFPVAVIFSGFYFYLLACRADKADTAVIYYRVDRICDIRELEQQNPIALEERHQLEAMRLYNQNMYMGDRTRIRFLYTGPSVQAILDKFPTAEIVRQKDGKTEIAAVVAYSRGTLMELLSQGSWIQVLGPEKVVEDMKREILEMQGNYEMKE